MCVFFILLSIFSSCAKIPKIISPADVEYIKIYSLPRNMGIISAIVDKECLIEWNKQGDTGGLLCRDTIIRSAEDINRFVAEVNTLKRKKMKSSIDIRTVTIIHMYSGEEIDVCFGSYGNMKMGDVFVKDSAELFNFLTEKVYSSHNLYYWAGETTRYILDHPYND